jgi:thiol-disulfide isomerase/thioredoxin
MRKVFLILIAAIICGNVKSQNTVILKVKTKGFSFTKLALVVEENPITGTCDEFVAQILDSGNYVIETSILSPQLFNLFINDVPKRFQILLCPNTESILNIDTTGNSLNSLTKNFAEWSLDLYNTILKQYSVDNYREQFGNKDSIDFIINELLKLKDKSLTQLNEIKNKFNLSDCEYNYALYRVRYAIFSYIYSDLTNLKYPINKPYYEFFKKLPLDDANAARQSIDYNRSLEQYIFYKLRLENNWIASNSFDYSSYEYKLKFYSKIQSEIKNTEVRNILLCRHICALLYRGETSAVNLYNRFKIDCLDSNLIKVADSYYEKYLVLTNQAPKPIININSFNISLFDMLWEKKGKVLYIDFWASWCSPCLHGLPFTKQIQEQYKDKPFEVVYVNVKDNIGAFETTSKKLDLEGTLIYLNNTESLEILNFLKANGIPRYLLIDKNGVIVDTNAPDPDSEAIIDKIEKLLN